MYSKQSIMNLMEDFFYVYMVLCAYD